MIKTLTKEDIKLSEWEFEAQQRGEQPILMCDFFGRSLNQYLLTELTGVATQYDYLFTDSNKLYNNPRHTELVIKKLKEKIDIPIELQKILRNSVEIPRGFNALADVVTKAIEDLSVSNTKLAELWKGMDEEYLKVIPWFYYPWYISRDNLLTDKVKTGLEKYRSEIEKICSFDEALLALVFLVKKTGFQLEQDEMLSLVQIAKNNNNFATDPIFKAAAAEYLKKFDWITTFILTPVLPMTYEQLVERVERALRESFIETLSVQKQAHKKNEILVEQLMAIISEDSMLLEYVSNARELGYVLTAGIEEAYMASARYLPLMQLVAKRIGVAFEEIKYFLSQEIQDTLTENQTISPALLAERKKGFVLMMKGGQQSMLFGNEGHTLSIWVDTELNKIDDSVRELKGQVACKGFVTGRARVAQHISDSYSLLEGEILVCAMTNPDYVPAMRRSAAIVTDEGGMLCHAAIMSREFNKPCVIGTKIATQLLKDGDMIEVDANTGYVRILQKVN